MECIKRWLEADESRTQAALADQLGVKPPSLNGWVRGDSGPSSTNLQKLHEVTSIPLATLVGDMARDEAARAKRQRKRRAA